MLYDGEAHGRHERVSIFLPFGVWRMSVVQFPAFRRADPVDPASLRQGGPSDPAAANVVALWGVCPWSDGLSDYDRRNINLYAQLLYEESEGASEDDLARDVLGVDPYRNRSRSLRILRSHLKRAHWIADTLLQTFC